MRKSRVLLTVNPGLIEGKRFSTIRSVVTALDKVADLKIVPVDKYDFKKNELTAYKRIAGGKFRRHGRIKPEADLWIVYSDGYYLDPTRLGFKNRRQYFDAQVDLHQTSLDKGWVGRVINSPETELKTLKSWLADLEPGKYRTIPTYLCKSFNETNDLRKEFGTLVAKRIWSGAGEGVFKWTSEEDILQFKKRLQEEGRETIKDYCFQPYLPGDEKRFWMIKGKFVAGRRVHGRKTPWSDSTEAYYSEPYNDKSNSKFVEEMKAAEKLAQLAGLEIGSVDFLGDNINEINGCGTVYTDYEYWKRIVDARPHLVNYLLDVVNAL